MRIAMNANLPSVDTCLKLMDDFAMLENIRQHSAVVAQAAETIWNKLAGRKESRINTLPIRELVVAGALLHDIAKTRCLKESCNHAEIGGEICEQLGYPDIAEIVREHVLLETFEAERYKKGVFLAKEIVYYADKRVLHDTIVTLPARLEYILERYGNNDPVRHRIIRKNFKKCHILESWICQAADCTEQTLLERSPQHIEL